MWLDHAWNNNKLCDLIMHEIIIICAIKSCMIIIICAIKSCMIVIISCVIDHIWNIYYLCGDHVCNICVIQYCMKYLLFVWSIIREIFIICVIQSVVWSNQLCDSISCVIQSVVWFNQLCDSISCVIQSVVWSIIQEIFIICVTQSVCDRLYMKYLLVLSGYEVPILMFSNIYYNYINYDEKYSASRRQSHQEYLIYVLALIGVRTLCPNTSNLWH
jgi:hypothetical protein